MYLIYEIGLHEDVFWCLYHVSTSICEIGATKSMKWRFECWRELKNTIWKTQNFDVRSSGEPDARAEKSSSQHFLQTWFPLERGSWRSSGELCRQAVRSSGRVHARAGIEGNQYFCRPKGPLERGKSTLERGPYFLKSCFCILCSVFRSLSLASILRLMLSIVNELMR